MRWDHQIRSISFVPLKPSGTSFSIRGKPLPSTRPYNGWIGTTDHSPLLAKKLYAWFPNYPNGSKSCRNILLYGSLKIGYALYPLLNESSFSPLNSQSIGVQPSFRFTLRLSVKKNLGAGRRWYPDSSKSGHRDLLKQSSSAVVLSVTKAWQLATDGYVRGYGIYPENVAIGCHWYK